MKLVLQEKKQELGDVFTFVFNPEKPISWRAGQSIKLELPIGAYDSEERRFTITTTPRDEVISITTRQTPSKFKQALFDLQLGSTIQGSSIEGNFTWEEAEKPHIFIAGGIGVTPFYALLKHRMHKRLPLHARLLLLGAAQKIPFLQQFDTWQQRFSEFRVTKRQRFVKDDVINTSGSYIYISGPTAMVVELQDQLLDELGLPPHLIKTDQFTGYRGEANEFI